MQPIVAIVADVRHFDGKDWHATPDQYLSATLKVAGLLPLIVPAFGDDIDFDGLLKRVDGVILSGSKTNVHPSNYGVEPSKAHEPFDEARDATALPLIRKAIETGVPLFAICRGIQELNVALGGSLVTEIQEQDGTNDHREPESDDQDVRFQLAHDVTIKQDGCVASILGERAKVNSLHRQAVSNIAPGLKVEATAPDGTIEAVSVIDAKSYAVGVQWHPEYWAETDSASRKLFEAFGDEVRKFAGQKG